MRTGILVASVIICVGVMSYPASVHAKWNKDCPYWIDNWGPEYGMDLLRCPKGKLRNARNKDIDAARKSAAEKLNIEKPKQSARAVYVHLCAMNIDNYMEYKPIEKPRDFKSGMAITCMRHADVLDRAKLTKELNHRFKSSDAKTILRRVGDSVNKVRAEVTKWFPKKKWARDWQVFYEGPMEVRQLHYKQRAQYAKEFAAIASFHKGILEDEIDGCDKTLTGHLSNYLRGTRGPLETIAKKMGDEVGYALTEALAKCYFYQDELHRTKGLMKTISKYMRRVSLPEKIYYRQAMDMAADRPHAEKKPHLVGKKYTGYKASDLRQPERPWNKMEEAWKRAVRDMLRAKRFEPSGVVAKVSKNKITFKKVKKHYIDQDCKETSKIDRITYDGRIIYRQKCVTTKTWSKMEQPKPIEVFETRGVKRGDYITTLANEDKYIVYTVAKNNKDKTPLKQLAGLSL